MKNVSRIVVLLCCSLLVGIFVLSKIDVVNGAWVNIWDAFDSNFGVNKWHEVRLEKLYLSATGDSVWILVNGNKIKLLNWLFVHNGNLNNVWESQMSVVAWWDNNGILGISVWIVWWRWNYVRGIQSVIGGWSQNVVYNGSGAVVAWGSWNAAWGGSVVLWWFDNVGSWNTVILWWNWNISHWVSSLILWMWSEWQDGTFLWNGLTWSNNGVSIRSDSAYIGAANWVLIGTYQPKSWVSLVVSGAVKMWSSKSNIGIPWEIMITGWCFYSYDGEKWHVLGKDSASGWSLCIKESINLSKTCKFGNKLIHEWDKVTAYSATYSVNCDDIKNNSVSCIWWQLVAQWWSTEYVYPYCYNVSGIQTVSGAWQGWNIFTAELEWNNSDLNDFEYDIISISRPAWWTGGVWPEKIVIMDRNLWATSNDVNSVDSYGYIYQWWNNYWLENEEDHRTNQWLQWNNSYNNHGYYSTGFINWINFDGDVWIDSSHHDGLWWWWTGDIFMNINAISATVQNRQWPCPSGRHVPSALEWSKLNEYWAGSWNIVKSIISLHGPLNSFTDYFKLPKKKGSSTMYDYWSSSPGNHGNSVYRLYMYNDGHMYVDSISSRSDGRPVRCFKN